MNPVTVALLYVAAVFALFFICGVIGWRLRRAIHTRQTIRRRLHDMVNTENQNGRIRKPNRYF